VSIALATAVGGGTSYAMLRTAAEAALTSRSYFA
jgi:hypothetical protein